MHVDRVNFKALPSIITWSEMGKQNMQAKKVYISPFLNHVVCI